MAKKTKLELTWIGKENRQRLEPRILIEDPEKSYHASHRISGNDIFDNRLIFGDNLLALNVIGRFKTSHRGALQNQPVVSVLGNVTGSSGDRQVPSYSAEGGPADFCRDRLPSLDG